MSIYDFNFRIKYTVSVGVIYIIYIYKSKQYESCKKRNSEFR